MKVYICEIVDQVYIIPTLKITYKRTLNGNLECILGWFKYEIVIAI